MSGCDNYIDTGLSDFRNGKVSFLYKYGVSNFTTIFECDTFKLTLSQIKEYVKDGYWHSISYDGKELYIDGELKNG